eukprot:tig00000459_g1101.t1
MPPKPAATLAAAVPSPDSPPVDLGDLDDLIDDRLRDDLKRVLDERDKAQEKLAKFGDLRETLETIRTHKLKKLNHTVSLSSEFIVQAEIPDTQYVYVDAGLGFHVQFTVEEALSFIEVRRKGLETAIEALSSRAVSLRTDIGTVLQLFHGLAQARSSSRPQQQKVTAPP